MGVIVFVVVIVVVVIVHTQSCINYQHIPSYIRSLTHFRIYTH